jgi:hypothetical protein
MLLMIAAFCLWQALVALESLYRGKVGGKFTKFKIGRKFKQVIIVSFCLWHALRVKRVGN